MKIILLGGRVETPEVFFIVNGKAPTGTRYPFVTSARRVYRQPASNKYRVLTLVGRTFGRRGHPKKPGEFGE